MLWIEMKKASGGRISPEQKDWHNYLQSINQNVIVTAGFEDAKLQIEDFTEEKDDGG
jgi:hypothetical protein